MALLVTDQGEIDSLRTLLNATHKIPRNYAKAASQLAEAVARLKTIQKLRKKQ